MNRKISLNHDKSQFLLNLKSIILYHCFPNNFKISSASSDPVYTESKLQVISRTQYKNVYTGSDDLALRLLVTAKGTVLDCLSWLVAWIILHAFFFHQLFFKSTFRNICSEIPLEFQTVWIQIRSDRIFRLSWNQTVCKCCQQTSTLDGKNIK